MAFAPTSPAIQAANTFSTTLSTAPFTVTSENALLAYVGIGDGTISHRAVTLVRWNTTEVFSAITGTSKDDANFLFGQWFELRNPTPGTHTVDLVLPFAGEDVAITVIAFTDANTVYGTPTTGAANDSSPSIVVASGTAEIVLCGITSDANATITVGGTGTLQGKSEAIGSDVCIGVESYAGATNVTATWTPSTPDTGWVSSGLSIKPLGGNSTQTPSGFGLSANIGSPITLIDAIKISPSGLVIVASLGTPSIQANASTTITPTGLGLTASVGSPTVLGDVNNVVTPTGFGLVTSLGTFTTEIDTTILPVGFGLTTSLGTPTPTIVNGSGDSTQSPSGFALTVSLGSPTILAVQNNTQTVSGFGLITSLGTPTPLITAIKVQPAGFGLTAGLGSPVPISTDTPSAILLGGGGSSPMGIDIGNGL